MSFNSSAKRPCADPMYGTASLRQCAGKVGYCAKKSETGQAELFLARSSCRAAVCVVYRLQPLFDLPCLGYFLRSDAVGGAYAVGSRRLSSFSAIGCSSLRSNWAQLAALSGGDDTVNSGSIFLRPRSRSTAPGLDKQPPIPSIRCRTS